MSARISMTSQQRKTLLALPDTEEEVVRHHTLNVEDLRRIAKARSPETRLSYALQLCALRFPGRHLRRDETLPAVMLDYVAEQVGLGAETIAGFARRKTTRYDQLASIKTRHGFRDLTDPVRASLKDWLTNEAIMTVDGVELLNRLITRMQAERIVIPGLSVIERMTAEAMHLADLTVVTAVDGVLTSGQREALNALVSDKVRPGQSRLAWLREPAGRLGRAALGTLLDKLDQIRATGIGAIAVPDSYHARLSQMAREGLRFAAQNFQRMRPTRRRTFLLATLREQETRLTDAALTMFSQLVGRANTNARKRMERGIAATAEEGSERLQRVASVLEAFVHAARQETDVVRAVTEIAGLACIEQDAALIRRNLHPGRSSPLGELAPEHRTFKRTGPRFLASFDFRSQNAGSALRQAMMVVIEHGGDRRRPLPNPLPLDHIEKRWRPHVVTPAGIDRTYWELATYFAVADALTSGDLSVPTSRQHRSVAELITPPLSSSSPASRLLAPPPPAVEEWLAKAEHELDSALLATADTLDLRDARLFAGDKLRFPKESRAEQTTTDAAKALADEAYRRLPVMRVTDVLAHVARWTGFVNHFTNVASGLPPKDDHAFMAALLAEATNLGLTRMAASCNVASRRAMLRMQTWHMRDETFRAALGNLTDAIHAEPLSTWLGEGWRASADGQAFNLGGPGTVLGNVNAHYGRDPIIKIYTTITDRYAPLHQTVIAGTASEAVHTLDGILGHDAHVDIAALHVDGGGVSDIVFALMHLLGLRFEPRIPRLSDRKLYAFQPKARYGRLAPLFGQRLDRQIIQAEWANVQQLVEALRHRIVTPSLILKKLAGFRQQNGLAIALREIGRVCRTLFTLRWFNEPALRSLVTAELNKGEARNSLARAVAFHRLGRFRERHHDNQQIRAASLTLVTAAIALFNCRYLQRALAAMRADGIHVDPALISRLSPLSWEHINLSGDYVWSDNLPLDHHGFLPLRSKQA